MAARAAQEVGRVGVSSALPVSLGNTRPLLGGGDTASPGEGSPRGTPGGSPHSLRAAVPSAILITTSSPWEEDSKSGHHGNLDGGDVTTFLKCSACSRQITSRWKRKERGLNPTLRWPRGRKSQEVPWGWSLSKGEGEVGAGLGDERPCLPGQSRAADDIQGSD